MSDSALNRVAQEIERFVRKKFYVAENDGRFTPSTHLYDNGYVDSLGVVELVEFLGSEFGVQIPDEDLLSDEFATVEGIAAVVRRLQERSG